MQDELISRQAVLNKILKFSVTDGRSVSVTGLWTEVNDLPSVTPQEPIDDVISRQAVLDLIADYDLSMGQVIKSIHALPSVNLIVMKFRSKKQWLEHDDKEVDEMTKEQKDKILKIMAEERNDYARTCNEYIAKENGKITGADYILQRLLDVLGTGTELQESEVEG